MTLVSRHDQKQGHEVPLFEQPHCLLCVLFSALCTTMSKHQYNLINCYMVGQVPHTMTLHMHPPHPVFGSGALAFWSKAVARSPSKARAAESEAAVLWKSNYPQAPAHSFFSQPLFPVSYCNKATHTSPKYILQSKSNTEYFLISPETG